MDTPISPLAAAIAKARAAQAMHLWQAVWKLPLWVMGALYAGVCFFIVVTTLAYLGFAIDDPNDRSLRSALVFCTVIGGSVAFFRSSRRFYIYLMMRPSVPRYGRRLLRDLTRLFGIAVLIELTPLGMRALRVAGIVIRKEMLGRLQDMLGHYVHTGLALTFSAAAIFMAVVLYMIRARARLFYGLSELAFGIMAVLWNVRAVVSAGILMPEVGLTPQDKAQIAFQFVASIYITIRGLNNIEDGLKKHADMLVANDGVPVDIANWLACESYLLWERVFGAKKPAAKVTVGSV